MLRDKRSGQANSVQIYGHISLHLSHIGKECDKETSNFSSTQSTWMTEKEGHDGWMVNDLQEQQEQNGSVELRKLDIQKAMGTSAIAENSTRSIWSTRLSANAKSSQVSKVYTV